MKAIGIKMVDLQPMRASMALQTGYAIGYSHPDDMGYEVTYPDGYKSWSPKDAADAAYFPIADETGSKIMVEDLNNFIVRGEGIRLGEKTTVVLDTTITGFDTLGTSACVDPTNYNQEIGNAIARKDIDDKIWGHLGFVLQWAKNGLKFKAKK